MIFDHMIVYFTSAVCIKLNIELDIFFLKHRFTQYNDEFQKKKCVTKLHKRIRTEVISAKAFFSGSLQLSAGILNIVKKIERVMYKKCKNKIN